jgi:DNA-binding response OmpR family regulator
MTGVARKILIVDDDPWVGKLVEFVARDFDFEPLMARDGAEALEMFGEELPDLAVIDVVLPKIDGLEVCRRLKASGTGAFTPVVIMSGIYRSEQEAFSKFRADAFFSKPITPELFGKRLSALYPPVAEIHAHAAMEPAASDETAFAALPLAMALARAHRLKRTGVLHVRTRGVRAELALLDGRLVSVKSEAWKESIAEALLRLQRISHEKRAQLELQVANGAAESFGDAAVKGDVLTAEELTRLIASLQMHRVIEAMRWVEGFHRFEQTEVAPSNVDLETPSLVHWGLRRSPLPPNALEEAVPQHTALLHRNGVADAVLRVLPLSRAEKWLLTQANGKNTFSSLWSQVKDDPVASEVLTRAMLTLHALGSMTVESRQIPMMVPATPLIEVEPPPARVIDGTPSTTLLTLWRERVTGVLVLELEEGPKTFYLKNGQLVAVRPPDGEMLDALLIKRGKIRPDVLPGVRMLMAAGRNIGDALVELQAISLTQLHAFVRGELRAALRELVRLDAVEARFTESPLSPQDLVRHDWDTGLAVIECVRSQDLSFVRRALPWPGMQVQRVEGTELLAEALPLSPNERNLWNLLASPQPWERLTAIGIVPATDQERALWVLLAAGIVKSTVPLEEDVVVEETKVAPEPEAALPNAADVAEAFSDTAPQPTIRAAIESTKEIKEATPPQNTAQIRKSRDVLALPDVVVDPGGETVPRSLYDQLAGEKREIEKRLLSLLDEHQGTVPRSLYEELVAEKNELKAQLVALVDEVIRMKKGGAFVPTSSMPFESLRPDPFETGLPSELEEGSILTVRRSRV